MAVRVQEAPGGEGGMRDLEDYGDPVLVQANRALRARVVLQADKQMREGMAKGRHEIPSPEFLCMVVEARNVLIEQEKAMRP